MGEAEKLEGFRRRPSRIRQNAAVPGVLRVLAEPRGSTRASERARDFCHGLLAANVEFSQGFVRTSGFGMVEDEAYVTADWHAQTDREEIFLPFEDPPMTPVRVIGG